MIQMFKMQKLGVLLIISGVFSGCQHVSQTNLEQYQKELQEKAILINNDFTVIRKEVDELAKAINFLYLKKDSILPTISKEKYQLASNGVFTKPFDDGGSAIFVSGCYPVNSKIKEIVYFTEPADVHFKEIMDRHHEVVQVYFNDKHSMNRIYPFFDVLSQYEPKMDIPSFNFYYLADETHNPEKKSLWVSEPYVDPAGRGWMVSAIAPVYFDDTLRGVPGIDVTINTITQRYISDNPDNMIMILENTGIIVAAQEAVFNMLSFPPLFEHKYIETIKQDTYRKEFYNLMMSKEEKVRGIAIDILQNKKTIIRTELQSEPITIIVAHIDELDWYLVEFIR